MNWFNSMQSCKNIGIVGYMVSYPSINDLES